MRRTTSASAATRRMLTAVQWALLPAPIARTSARVVPCPNGVGTVDVQLGERRRRQPHADRPGVDSADNAGDVSQPIAGRQHPAAVAAEAAVVGRRRLADRQTGSPCAGATRRERFAPIARRALRAVPGQRRQQRPDTAAAGRKRCVSNASRARHDHRDRGPGSCPGEGDWQLRRLWLEDAAGNQNPDAGGEGLRPWLRRHATDRSWPSSTRTRPTRRALNVRASDDASGIASRRDRGRAAPARRRGGHWTPRSRGQGLTALIDDEQLRARRL